MKKKVALLTTFAEADSGYSLVSVAETQIHSLIDHGYDPAVLVQDNFKPSEREDSIWRPEMIDLRPVVPFLHLTEGVADDFDERVEKIYLALQETLQGIHVVITHDIILQKFYKEHNVAMRKLAEDRPDILWLHWIHSCPTPSEKIKYPLDCRYKAPPGYIIYPNDIDRPFVVRTYKLAGQEQRVKVCRAGHAIDPLLAFNYDRLTRDLATKSDLHNGEISVVYPARLDKGKQPERIIRLMAGVRETGYEPRLLIIDWQSTGERFQRYIDQLIKLSEELGVADCVKFTSRLDDRCSQGVPKHVVLELMDLSNAYIHPSMVETYGLTVHEAMTRGCLCVLNHDLPVNRELFGDNAIYMDFGSDRFRRAYKDEQAFWNNEAKRLIAEYLSNRAVVAKTTARREWTPQALWKTFEPLLFLEPVNEAGKTYKRPKRSRKERRGTVGSER